VKPNSSRGNRLPRFQISPDGDGVANHLGSVALGKLTDVLGLTTALSNAFSRARKRRSAHDPGLVIRDLVVMLADGGDCLTDLGALRDQPKVFGQVASTSTAWLAVDRMSEMDLEGLRRARGQARE
jgi:hypothetical protein